MAKKSGLGSGLHSLFEQNAADSEVSGVRTLRLSEIEPSRAQPRKRFDDDAVTSLAESIQAHGMLQPIVVRPLGEGRYQIVAGERRWRAAKRAGISQVPVIVRDLSDMEASQFALIENLQREDLNPIEEAQAYKELSERYGMTQEEIARTVGRSRAAVANSLRLLSLPEQVKTLLENGSLTAGHAKALAGIKDKNLMLEYARRAAEGKATVRDIERAAKQREEPPARPAQKTPKEIYCEEMEISLQNTLGRKVSVQSGKKKGTLTLEFYDEEDLRYLCSLLTAEDGTEG